MDLETFKAKTVEILAGVGDAGIVSSGLAQLVDMATIATAETIQLQAALDMANEQNQTLRQANMDLFLKIPVTAGAEEKPAEPDPEEKPLFESLFANGELL